MHGSKQLSIHFCRLELGVLSDQRRSVMTYAWEEDIEMLTDPELVMLSELRCSRSDSSSMQLIGFSKVVRPSSCLLTSITQQYYFIPKVSSYS